jgi:hypothetical protein
MRPTY